MHLGSKNSVQRRLRQLNVAIAKIGLSFDLDFPLKNVTVPLILKVKLTVNGVGGWESWVVKPHIPGILSS